MTIKNENFTGADASGADGAVNRVLTLNNTALTSGDGFLVFVSGLSLALTSEYTVVNASSGTTITFLNALFNDQQIVAQYNQGVVSDTGVYCSSADVFEFLQLGASSDVNFTGKTDFDTATNPTKVTVDGWINESEDYIDQETGHAWRAVTITKEQHHLEFPHYQVRDGSEISLLHRNIRTLTAGTDLLEVWDGTQDLDYLTNKIEGRNNDFWVNEQDGVIFIKTYPTYTPRTFGVQVTYRFGDTVVPGTIKRACILFTAVHFLQSEDRSVLLPEGSSNIPYQTKSEGWEKKAQRIIENRKEMGFINT